MTADRQPLFETKDAWISAAEMRPGRSRCAGFCALFDPAPVQEVWARRSRPLEVLRRADKWRVAYEAAKMPLQQAPARAKQGQNEFLIRRMSGWMFLKKRTSWFVLKSFCFVSSRICARTGQNHPVRTIELS